MNKKSEIINAYKQKIMKEADKLFCELGIDKTTMDMISREAGYSKATVYSYFPSKNEVLFSIVHSRMKMIMNTISLIALEDCSVYDKFIKICVAYSELQKQDPVYFEAMISNIDTNINNPSLPEIYQKIYKTGIETNEIIGRVIKEGIDEGLLEKNIAINETILFTWGCISGLIRMASQKEEYIEMNGISRDEFLMNSFKRLIKGLMKR